MFLTTPIKLKDATSELFPFYEEVYLKALGNTISHGEFWANFKDKSYENLETLFKTTFNKYQEYWNKTTLSGQEIIKFSVRNDALAFNFIQNSAIGKFEVDLLLPYKFDTDFQIRRIA